MKKLILSFVIMILMISVGSPVHAVNLNEPTLYANTAGASTLGLAYMTNVGEVIIGGKEVGKEETRNIFLGYTPPDIPILGSLSFEYTMEPDDKSLFEVIKYVFYPLTDDISLGLGITLYSKHTDSASVLLPAVTPWISMSIKLLNI